MLDKTQFYINGEWINPNSKKILNVINPSDEKIFAKISLGDNLRKV